MKFRYFVKKIINGSWQFYTGYSPNNSNFENYTGVITAPGNEGYFTPEGVIKKPSLYLADILPDLNAESFLVFSILAYLITSALKFITI